MLKIISSFINSKGQLETNYHEEHKGEYEEFLKDRLILKNHLDFDTMSDEKLISLKNRLQHEWWNKESKRKLYQVYDEITRRRL